MGTTCSKSNDFASPAGEVICKHCTNRKSRHRDIGSTVRKAAYWVQISWAYRRCPGISAFAVHELAYLCKLACMISHRARLHYGPEGPVVYQ